MATATKTNGVEAPAIDAEYEPGEPGNVVIEAPQTALIRLENETQMIAAKQTPRDLAKIKKALETELTVFPELAERAIYIKPLGKKCVGRGTRDEHWVMTFHRDLSVRAAESLRALYPNINCAVTLEEAADSATITGIILDCEMNSRVLRQRRVSKFATRRGGRVEKLAEDKFDNLVNATGAKVFRDLILRSVPQGLRLWYWTEASRVILDRKDAKGKAIPVTKRIKASVDWFSAQFGVTEQQLAEVLGHTPGKDANNDLLYLIGIANLIVEGTMIAAEIFGMERRAPASAPKSPDPAGVRNAEQPPAETATTENEETETGVEGLF